MLVEVGSSGLASFFFLRLANAPEPVAHFSFAAEMARKVRLVCSASNFHQCEMDDHVVAAKHKLEEIIEFLRDRERRMGERA